VTSSNNPDRDLALPYAPSARREDYAALWALDEILGQTLTSTREPMLAEIKLRWWAEQLEHEQSDAAPVLARLTMPFAELTSLVDGWAALLAPLPLPVEVLDVYASGRGRALFSAVPVCKVDMIALHLCGEGWALADFAYRCEDTPTRSLAIKMARQRLTKASIAAVSRQSMMLAILAELARRDVVDGHPRRHPLGSRRRALRVLRYSLLGRLY
jgi:15-cis-phytoene synthase